MLLLVDVQLLLLLSTVFNNKCESSGQSTRERGTTRASTGDRLRGHRTGASSHPSVYAPKGASDGYEYRASLQNVRVNVQPLAHKNAPSSR